MQNMNYIYDIVLNFNKDYYEFYEWKKSDKVINVKKIPAFRVDSKDIVNFKYNMVKVDTSFLNKICNLTFFYTKVDYKYVCLFSDSNETIGVMFDKTGRLIKRSSLVFDEEDEVNEEVYSKDITEINYIENTIVEPECISRLDKEKMEYLYKFINNLDSFKDADILKYIYYDYFEKEIDNPVRIKEELNREIFNLEGNRNKLYELVKILKKVRM